MVVLELGRKSNNGRFKPPTMPKSNDFFFFTVTLKQSVIKCTSLFSTCDVNQTKLSYASSLQMFRNREAFMSQHCHTMPRIFCCGVSFVVRRHGMHVAGREWQRIHCGLCNKLQAYTVVSLCAFSSRIGFTSLCWLAGWFHCNEVCGC